MTKEMVILNYRDTIILRVNSYSVGYVIKKYFIDKLVIYE